MVESGINHVENVAIEVLRLTANAKELEQQIRILSDRIFEVWNENEELRAAFARIAEKENFAGLCWACGESLRESVPKRVRRLKRRKSQIRDDEEIVKRLSEKGMSSEKIADFLNSDRPHTQHITAAMVRKIRQKLTH